MGIHDMGFVRWVNVLSKDPEIWLHSLDQLWCRVLLQEAVLTVF